MNISGIRPDVGFYDYNSIRINSQISAEDIDDAIKATDRVDELLKDSVKAEVSDEDFSDARAAQTFGAYDFALQYRPNETYELKGEYSDIRKLDVERAVNDLQKDEILHQYQFFVGNRGDSTASGIYLENFTL